MSSSFVLVSHLSAFCCAARSETIDSVRTRSFLFSTFFLNVIVEFFVLSDEVNSLMPDDRKKRRKARHKAFRDAEED